jgi:hypothetical protein
VPDLLRADALEPGGGSVRVSETRGADQAVIVVVAPVLGRPQNAQPLADSLAAASPGVRLVFVVSSGDDAQHSACLATGADVIEAPWPAGHGDFARKVNLAADLTTERFVFQGADDIEFAAGWDDEALRVAEDTGAGVVGTNDNANPAVKQGRHSTHSLIRRAYIDDPGASMDGPGSVFSVAYGHQFCDNELVALAQARGEWAFAERAVVVHRHWVWGTALKDATYAKGDATHVADARMFMRRRTSWSRLSATQKRPGDAAIRPRP